MVKIKTNKINENNNKKMADNNQRKKIKISAWRLRSYYWRFKNRFSSL